MGTGQTIITIGALVLLSMAILNLNNNIANSDFSLAQNRYRLEALSIMSTYTEQGSQYFFDEASTDTTSAKDLVDFTDPAFLGFEANDLGVIDDFDDYNGHVLLDTAESGIVYRVWFEVDYVELSGDTISPSIVRTYHKRMRIFMTDNYATPLIYKDSSGVQVHDTLSLDFVQSYWFYN